MGVPSCLHAMYSTTARMEARNATNNTGHKGKTAVKRKKMHATAVATFTWHALRAVGNEFDIGISRATTDQDHRPGAAPVRPGRRRHRRVGCIRWFGKRH